MASGGYDVDIIEKPNVPLKTECLICHLILRDPYEIMCCNNFFCKSCAEEYQGKGFDKCPICANEDFKFREATAQKRMMNEVKVACIHKNKNCIWMGQLGDLDKHLNLNPPINNIYSGCDYVEVECPVCKEHFERANLSQHKLDECPNEVVACINHNKGCGWRGMRKTLEEHLHLDDLRYEGCNYVQLLCKHCNVSILRKKLMRHERKCLEEIIRCEFGCTDEFARKNLQEHNSRNLNKHMHRLCENSKSIMNEVIPILESRVDNLQENLVDDINLLQENAQNFRDSIQELYSKIRQLHNKNNETNLQLKSNIRSLEVGGIIIGAVFVILIAYIYSSIPSTSVHRSTESIFPQSIPFPFKRSYLLPKGSSFEYTEAPSGRHLVGSSIFVPSVDILPTMFTATLYQIIKKDGSPAALELCFDKMFDQDSQYLNATVYVQLINQKTKTRLHHVIYFSLFFTEANNRGLFEGGCFNFIRTVEESFIRANYLKIRIITMELNGNRKLPYTFSLCQYSDYHGRNPKHTVWTSNPFYSRSGDFEFTMQVYPRGSGSGLGTHLSLYVEKANNSEPFLGKIEIFIKQVTTENSLFLTLSFDKDYSSLGWAQLMTHSDVLETLVYFDCIILGISDIQSDSDSGLSRYLPFI